ncbi:MAG: hypothetical protein Q8918_13345 [Bacteroidota bacterium]|nr:hypothetical protein [Bacteroidota bacterium]MDP4251089.1 hypothetical protein [Bacteroidota bacterium]
MKTTEKEIRTRYRWRPEPCVAIAGANMSIILFVLPHPKWRFNEAEWQYYAGLRLVGHYVFDAE